MFCMQDPSYENSMYLHETLLAECAGAAKGAGAYAFASKEGIKLLLMDENFKRFLENGTYILVVGTDDITNEHSIHALMELQKRYSSHLIVKAYMHSGKGSTFHPKFSWFSGARGGSLIIGSGNLTQRGLRHNREAYAVIRHDTQGMLSVIEEWDKWFIHSEPFLFDITDPVVMAKAKQNSEKMRTAAHAKTEVKKLSAASAEAKKLSDIYKTQPIDLGADETESSLSVEGEAGTDLVSISAITDEELDIDASYWTIDLDSAVLIAEIPKSGNRWKQANFDKKTFECYFGATCGENGAYRILLKSVDEDGAMRETEVRPSVSVSSKNYRFELEAANGLAYPKGSKRPIAIFANVSCRDFIYMLLMPGEDHYDEVMNFMSQKALPSANMRRLQYKAKDVFQQVPNLAIWKRLEKEDMP